MYLNDGKGYACAGQANAKDSPPLLSKVPIDLDFEENLGAAPPMGSSTNKVSFPCIDFLENMNQTFCL